MNSFSQMLKQVLGMKQESKRTLKLKGRLPRLEALEDRMLLAVTAGDLSQTAVLAAIPADQVDALVEIPVSETENPLSTAAIFAAAAPNQVITVSSQTELNTALSNAQAGDVIRLGANIDLTSSMTVASGKEITLDLAGYTLARSSSAENFSVITNEGNLTIKDSSEEGTGKITGGNYDYGGGVCNNGTLTISGGSITGNEVTSFGGGVFNNGTLTINGGNITGNSADQGGGVYNEHNSTLTITGGDITDNEAFGYGGGIYNGSTQTLTISGGSITGNNANRGGGVFNDRGTLTISGGNITENSTQNGGGVFNYAGTLTISGGNITENSAELDGGGVYNLGTLTMTGGNITENNATQYGGGVFNFGGSPFTVGGTAVIDGNLKGSDASNFYVQNYNGNLGAITISTETPLAKGAKIGVTAFSQISTYGSGSADDVSYFSSDNAKKTVVYDSENQYLKVVPLTVTSDQDDGEGTLRWAITNAGAGGIIDFDSSLSGKTITLSSGLTIDRDVTIDASALSDGMTISGSGKYRIFTIGETDQAKEDAQTVVLKGLTLTNGASLNGSAIYTNNWVILTMTDCTITGCTASQAGTIYTNWTTLGMTNCLVAENDAGEGSALFNMAGTAELTNSTFAGNGGETTASTIMSNDQAKTTLYNCILAENKLAAGQAEVERLGVVNAYCTLSSFTDWSNKSEEGVINYVYDSEKALFTSPETGDYTLSKDSQAIDIGDNSYIDAETDLLGNVRIYNKIVDLGACEYLPPLDTPEILTGTAPYFVSNSLNSQKIVWTEISGATSYKIQYSNNGGESWTICTTEETYYVFNGLTYGDTLTYTVKAVGDHTNFADSGWSAEKSFIVCPVDIDCDGEIGNTDRALLISAWFSSEGDEDYFRAADIDGDGEVAMTDYFYLHKNWLKEVAEGDIVNPPAPAPAKLAFGTAVIRPRTAADSAFLAADAVFESADLTDLF